jgi:hypothetical protein
MCVCIKKDVNTLEIRISVLKFDVEFNLIYRPNIDCIFDN